MHTEIKYHKEPQLESPIMVCGLPGIGSVAWLAVNHLQKELRSELFAEVLSPMFSPKVWLTTEGIVNLMKGEFHFWKNTNGEPGAPRSGSALQRGGRLFTTRGRSFRRSEDE